MTVEELKKELDRFPDDMEVFYFYSTGYINHYVPANDIEMRRFDQGFHPDMPYKAVLIQSI